jgi:hypothetical protein
MSENTDLTGSVLGGTNDSAVNIVFTNDGVSFSSRRRCQIEERDHVQAMLYAAFGSAVSVSWM